jgi:hypothetical protein
LPKKASVELVNNAIYEDLPLKVKATLVGIDPLSEIDSEITEETMKAFHDINENISFLQIADKTFVYDKQAVLNKLTLSNHFKEDFNQSKVNLINLDNEYSKEDATLDLFITNLINNNDWRLNLLKGYSQEDALAAKGDISVTLDGKATQEKAKALPEVSEIHSAA